VNAYDNKHECQCNEHAAPDMTGWNEATKAEYMAARISGLTVREATVAARRRIDATVQSVIKASKREVTR
jgi:hypothetical protein